MDDIELIQQIEKHGNLFEVEKVTTYTGIQGETKEAIKIEIHDMGPAAGQTRYSVVATSIDKPDRYASGNPAETVELALMMVHWSELKS